MNFRRQPALRPVDLAQARRAMGSSAGTAGGFPHGFDLTRFAPDRLHSACDGRRATRPPGPPVLAQGCIPLDRSPPPLQAWYQEAPPHATGTTGHYHGSEGWPVEGVSLTSESVVSAGGARDWVRWSWIVGRAGGFDQPGSRRVSNSSAHDRARSRSRSPSSKRPSGMISRILKPCPWIRSRKAPGSTV